MNFFPRRLVEQSNQIPQERIEEKTNELEAAHKQALYYARFDPLTKLMNRQFLEEKISSRMMELPYGTMIIMDIEAFKRNQRGLWTCCGRPRASGVFKIPEECIL